MPINDKNRCRVCGLDQGEPIWGEDGRSPTYIIFSCCGVEFGYEDSTINGIIQYREKWINDGAKWFHEKEKPDDWTVEEQLKAVPKEYI